MAQRTVDAESHVSGEQEKKKSTTKLVNSELNKLCFLLNDRKKDGLKELFKFSVNYALMNHNSSTNSQGTDSVFVAENVRRLFLKNRGEQGDAIGFEQHYRKLKEQKVLKKVDATLELLLHLANTGPSSSQGARRPVLIPPLSNAEFALPSMRAQRHGTPESVTLSSSCTKEIGCSQLSTSYVTMPDNYNSFPRNGRSGLKFDLSDQVVSVPRPLPDSSHSAGQATSRSLVSTQARKVDVPEWALIQDLIYSFQGINGQYLKYDAITQGYIIDSQVNVTQSRRRLCLRLAELSWCHLQVRDYCDNWLHTKNNGLVSQSLTAFMRDALTDFYRVVAGIRQQASVELADTGDFSQLVSLPTYEDMKGLTLRRLAMWIHQPLQRFTWLTVICQVTKDLRGGGVASAVHGYLEHGDPLVTELFGKVLSAVCKPIFSMIGRWILDGELDDPYGEFFVAGNANITGERLWHEKYSLRESMVPTFITMERARKILITGKSINFLREVCNDHTKLVGRTKLQEALESTDVEAMFMNDGEGELAALMDKAYLETSKRVIEVLMSKYMFLEHLQALRRYMLLGQGDFIRHLMELLEPELQKPASEVYSHSLSGILESAIRATNALHEDKDILKRLDVRFLQQSPGDCGWDVFVLDYHTAGPIGTVFGPTATEYLLLFQSLWKMKRIEWVLSRLWTKQITASKELRKVPELDPVLAQIHLLTSEMVHFVHQLQYYVLFEVVACSWEELLAQINQAESLDDIIAAHQSFLRTVKAGALLDSKTLDLSIHLRAMFETILQLEYQVDLLHARAERELKMRDKRNNVIEARGQLGLFGITAEEEKQFDEASKNFLEGFLPCIRIQIKTLTNSYQSCVRKLLYLLSSTQDISLQLLSFRLDFNENYKRSDPRLSASITYQHRRLSEMGLQPSAVE